MASLEAKLSSALTEIKNLHAALTSEVQERRRDHDEIVEQRERIKTIFEKLKNVVSKSEFEDAIRRLKTLEGNEKERNSGNRLKTLEDFQCEYEEKKQKQQEDRSKRIWQAVFILLGAFVTAIIGGVISKWLFFADAVR